MTGFESIPGQGIRGVAEGRTWYAGNDALLSRHGIVPDARLQRLAEGWMQEAKTVVWSPTRSGRSPCSPLPMR